jgi:thiol-activated cytolysin
MKNSMMSMFAVLLLLLGVSMVWNGCRKDDDDDPIPITGDFDEYVKALPYAFGAYDAEPQTIAEGSESDVGYYCDTKEYEYSPGYSDVILLDPTTDVIAPGMFIKPGQSLTDGNYTAITNAKKPITLTRSTGEQITIDNPSLSSIRQGIKEMNQNAGTGAAQVDYLYQSIYSKEELKLSVGAHYKNPWAEISAGLDWDKEVEKNFMYAKFVQVFYTVEVDTDQRIIRVIGLKRPCPTTRIGRNLQSTCLLLNTAGSVS